jgi:DNA-binding response OmpR family regulator
MGDANCRREADNHLIDVTVACLRPHLEPISLRLVTVPGHGYRPNAVH